VGAIIEQTGFRKLEDLKGIGKEMPVTLGIFTVGALSMVGLPLLPGFISKWYLALAAIEGQKPILVGVILLSSLLNAVYYFPIVINAFFGEENLGDKVFNAKHKPYRQLIPIFLLIAAMLYVGTAAKSIINMIDLGLI
jgi:multicomponent Na+:H+ antiporter subunit D